MIHFDFRAILISALSAGLLAFSTGCFSEQSFPMRSDDYVRLSHHDASKDSSTSTREWLRDAHQELYHLLPRGRPRPLLTEDLVNAKGRPADVLRHFNVDRDTLETLGGNYQGLVHSAQLTGPDFDPCLPPLVWPGCEDVWIPVDDNISLHGLLCYARDERGERLDSDCIVLLPGMLGHNGSLRTRNLTTALLGAGLHVLAVELRGHGQTDVKYPHVYYTWGTVEPATS